MGKEVVECQCLWYTEWLCDVCDGSEKEGKNCASYIPALETKKDKQLNLFET